MPQYEYTSYITLTEDFYNVQEHHVYELFLLPYLGYRKSWGQGGTLFELYPAVVGVSCGNRTSTQARCRCHDSYPEAPQGARSQEAGSSKGVGGMGTRLALEENVCGP